MSAPAVDGSPPVSPTEVPGKKPRDAKAAAWAISRMWRSQLCPPPIGGAVELAGSRARGTHEELSDWDFAVETSDFDSVARDLPTLVEPLEPLGAQWEPLGHFPV